MGNANYVLNDANLGDGATTVTDISNSTTYFATNINPKVDVVNIVAHQSDGKKRGHITKVIGYSGTMTLEMPNSASVQPAVGHKFIATAGWFANQTAFTASFTEVSSPREMNAIWKSEVSYEDVPSTTDLSNP